MKHFLSIFYLIGFFVISGCSANPNEKANELFVKASQIMQGVNIDSESYSKALVSYRNVQNKVQYIVSHYPSSNIAVSLVAEETKISGLTLSEFKALGGYLKPLAEAEKEPLLTALFVANKIQNAFFKAAGFTDIAYRYADIGQREKAEKMLSKALEVTETIEDAYRKASALVDVAAKYADVGQREKAEEILSKALEVTETIEDADRKALALVGIVDKYTDGTQVASEQNTAILHDILYKIELSPLKQLLMK